MGNIIDSQDLDHLIRKIVSERSSKRNFLPDSVSINIVKDIIQDASRAPSGTNTQPWKVTCVTGETKKKFRNLNQQVSESLRFSNALHKGIKKNCKSLNHTLQKNVGTMNEKKK